VRTPPYLVAAIAVVCVSVGSILVRLAQAPALAVSFQRVFIASLLLAPLSAPRALVAWRGLTRAQRLALVGSGAALALHFGTWIASLSYTTVAASVLLVNAAPLFTVAFARLFLREPASRRVLVAIALAFVGAVLIAAGDWSSGGADPLLGDALALAGAVALSLYHVIGRGLRSALALDAYVLWVWGSAAAVLAVAALAVRTPLVGYPARTWAAFLALALVPTLAGHGLVNLALRLLPAPTVGLFLLGEPIGATLLALALFGETPGVWTLAGGAVILAALAIVVTGKDV
jgi:drug/metabolite transporter (DMT)-like permease